MKVRLMIALHIPGSLCQKIRNVIEIYGTLGVKICLILCKICDLYQGSQHSDFQTDEAVSLLL